MADTVDNEPRALVDSDLVECFVVVVPDLDSLAGVASALADLVRAETIRVLDLVAVARADDATVKVLEIEAVPSLAALTEVEGEVGGLLSDRDIDRASVVLEPGTAALLLVAEDRWAQPISVAAQHARGRIVAGERIPAARVEAALSGVPRAPHNAEDKEEKDDATRWDGP
jgi:hypothetical protein